jgi:arsenate reductase (thioredoxin)
MRVLPRNRATVTELLLGDTRHSVKIGAVKQRVLFICVHKSARSQMAEAWLNRVCGDVFEAQSAGLEPGTINPLVVQAMAPEGIDLSNKTTQRVFDVWNSGQRFDYVITVCSDAEAEGCPIFPGVITRLHWPFPDPSRLTGTEEEKLQMVREIRDQIRSKIEDWCEEVCPHEVAHSSNTSEKAGCRVHRNLCFGLRRHWRDCHR